jgi:hypothetical protein
VTDWATISALATAGGTLVLAAATFSSVRSSSRSARTTERALLAGLLPVLVPSHVHDPTEKIRFVDDHWVEVDGGQAAVEVGIDAVYLAMTLRNVGQGLAVLDRCDFVPEQSVRDGHRDPADFHRLTRDIYVPPGDLGFWQGAYRDPSEPEFALVRDAIEGHGLVTIDLLYSNNEGGQRTVSRFVLTPRGGSGWVTTVARHWRLDQPDPR